MFVPDLKEVKVFIRPGVTDMRKSINGLAIMVQEEMKLDPYDKMLFLFCNKRRHLMKVLYWDKTGFCLWYKRLEKNRFPWLKKGDVKFQITEAQLKLLLNGINFFEAHEELKFSRVG